MKANAYNEVAEIGAETRALSRKVFIETDPNPLTKKGIPL
jgi:hypothetical protein